jgi:transposase
VRKLGRAARHLTALSPKGAQTQSTRLKRHVCWGAYDYLDPTSRQICWAHLLRDFTAHSEGTGEQEDFGNAGLVVARDLFEAWQQFQQDGARAALQARIAPLQAKLRTELEHASRKSTKTKYHRQFARNLVKRWPALWTFSHTDGVEPTNNHAERGLRGAVIHRKLSLGTQSERGERSLERLLTASITCRPRKQSLYAYHTQVITAHAHGDPIPTLS